MARREAGQHDDQGSGGWPLPGTTGLLSLIPGIFACSPYFLKRANPKIQVWMYKDLSGIRSDDCRNFQGRCGHCPRGVADSRYLSSGMGYCWVKRHHPRWLLASSETGHPFQFRNYPSIWETDFGNRAYQRQWIHNVLTDVRDHGWSGVEVDNALTTADAYGISGKYPSNSAVQAATYSALRNIGHAMRDAGVASVFNVGDARSFPGLWQRWLRPVDGLEQEFYLGHPGNPRSVLAGTRTRPRFRHAPL